ncbi:MAG: hypothetical protein ACU843_13620 [Gammaproteobacteria bacterium]
MFRKLLLGTSAVFAIWTGLDFIFHGLLLGPSYEETARLWRPKGEAKMVLNSLVVLVSSFMFTLIFTLLVKPKGLRVGTFYGALFGTAAGVSSGLGAYAFTPVPCFMALIWTITGILEGVAGGAALGWLVKEDSPTETELMGSS